MGETLQVLHNWNDKEREEMNQTKREEIICKWMSSPWEFVLYAHIPTYGCDHIQALLRPITSQINIYKWMTSLILTGLRQNRRFIGQSDTRARVWWPLAAAVAFVDAVFAAVVSLCCHCCLTPCVFLFFFSFFFSLSRGSFFSCLLGVSFTDIVCINNHKTYVTGFFYTRKTYFYVWHFDFFMHNVIISPTAMKSLFLMKTLKFEFVSSVAKHLVGLINFFVE